MASRKIEVEVVGDAKQLERALGRASSSSQTNFQKIQKAAKYAGLAIAGALGVTAKIGFDELSQSLKVGAQTNAVLQSTGSVAHVTAGHVDEMAQALLAKSGVDDEVIKSGENLLLTFCLEESAEALTMDRGWVRHDELSAGDWILGYDPEDDCAKWEAVDSVHRFEVDGDLTRWRSKQIDVATTPHHRWWTTGRTASGGQSKMQPYKFRTTEEVSGHEFAVKIGGGNPAGFAEQPIYSDELVELVGWVVTEGWVSWIRPSTPHQNGVGFSQSESANPEKVERIRDLTRRLRSQGHEIGEYTEDREPGTGSGVAVKMQRASKTVQWTFGKSLGKAVKGMVPEKKLTPALLTQLTAPQAELLLDTLLLGDGSVDKSGGRQFIQKDEEQLGVVAMLCAMLGIRTSMLGRGDALYLCKTEHAWGNALNATQEHYRGIVWCPHLRTGIFMARCNGRTFWTGNTKIRNEGGKGNDIFDRATKSALDLSVALGKDMPSASRLVGKALNDPVKGLSALSRVGVTFTDGQKKQIEAMVKSGNVMGAQKKILGELNKRFGGSAEAVGKTLPGQLNIAKETFKNLAAEIVQAALPAFTSVTREVLKGVKWLQEHSTVAKILFGALGGLAAVLLTVSAATKIYAAGQTIVKAATAAWTAGQWLLNAALTANPIGLVIVAVAALAVALVVAYKKSATFRAIVTGAFQAVQSVVGAVVGFIRSHWRTLVPILLGPLAPLALVALNFNKIKGVVSSVVSYVRGKIGALVGIVSGVASRISKAASGMFDGIKTAFRSAINYIINAWNGLSFSIPGVDTHIPGVGKVGGFTIGTPDIPNVAQGGIVMPRPGGTLLRAGEAGRAEAIIPLPAGAKNLGEPPLVQVFIGEEQLEQRMVRVVHRANKGIAKTIRAGKTWEPS